MTLREGLVLRFRDLVTETGGTIDEHVRVLREVGYVWWGWWYRQFETIPTEVFQRLFPAEASDFVPLSLFDADQLKVFAAVASEAVVTRTSFGLQSPEFGATPEYYLRGRYPAWFKLTEIGPEVSRPTVNVLSRPTLSAPSSVQAAASVKSGKVSLTELRDERPTLWVADLSGNVPTNG